MLVAFRPPKVRIRGGINAPDSNFEEQADAGGREPIRPHDLGKQLLVIRLQALSSLGSHDIAKAASHLPRRHHTTTPCTRRLHRRRRCRRWRCRRAHHVQGITRWRLRFESSIMPRRDVENIARHTEVLAKTRATSTIHACTRIERHPGTRQDDPKGKKENTQAMFEPTSSTP